MDYKTNDPRGWMGDPKLGAALGRPAVVGDPSASLTLILRQVNIDEGGYDRNGTYFGTPMTMWWYGDDGGEVDRTLRAATWDAAAAKVRALYPTATVVRPSEPSPDDIEEMLAAYTEAMLEDINSLENDDGSAPHPVGENDLATETRATLREDCVAFAKDHFALFSGEAAMAGHYLWHVRQGSGLGFNDYPERFNGNGRELHQAARELPTRYPYVGDDGKVWL